MKRTLNLRLSREETARRLKVALWRRAGGNRGARRSLVPGRRVQGGDAWKTAREWGALWPVKILAP